MSAPQLRVLHGDESDIDTWENEGGTTCAAPPVLTVLHNARGYDVYDPETGFVLTHTNWRVIAWMLTLPNRSYTSILAYRRTR